jgi:hypothetical protein
MSVQHERGFGRSLRADLERDRNTLRRRRLEMVMAVLRERAAERERSGVGVPPPLRAAIADFGRELGALGRTRHTRTAGKP